MQVHPVERKGTLQSRDLVILACLPYEQLLHLVVSALFENSRQDLPRGSDAGYSFLPVALAHGDSAARPIGKLSSFAATSSPVTRH